MLPGITLFISGLLLAALVMTLVWWRQVYTKNAGIVDAWWSYNFGIIAVLYAVSAPGDLSRKVLITTLAVVWSIRLGTHLLIRNMGHAHEDTRYRKLREEYGANEGLYMWRFFMYQAVSNALLSIPFLIVCLDERPVRTVTAWIGVTVWVIAVLGEAIADQQLKAFKSHPGNKGKVCQRGLWNYSRHPNYFFEWLVWVAFAIVASDSPYGWAAVFAPLLMYLLLSRVTGIPMLEELALKSKGEAYVQYQKTTSAFFPWFKRKTNP